MRPSLRLGRRYAVPVGSSARAARPRRRCRLRSEELSRECRRDPLAPEHTKPSQAGIRPQATLITPRHGSDLGACQRSVHERRHRLRQAGRDLHTLKRHTGTAASRSRAQELDDDGGAVIRRVRGAGDAAGVDGRAYGRGKYCPPGEKSGRAASTSRRSPRSSPSDRDPQRLREVWEGWHTISPPMKQDYARFVELSNKGAKELGFADTGAMWRSRYDMPPDDFAQGARSAVGAGAAALPLAARLRRARSCTRSTATPCRPTGRFRRTCSATSGRRTGRTSTTSSRRPGADAGYSLDRHPQARARSTPVDMVQIGERFFTSLGFAPLPKTFWERSLFVQAARPRGRLPRQRLGHRQRGRPAHQDVHRADRGGLHRRSTTSSGTTSTSAPTTSSRCIFRDSANDGFHEAIGDTIALSVTPEYLVQDRPARQGARRVARHRAAAARGARQGRVPAVRPARSTSGAGRCSAARSRRPTTTRPGGSCG